LHRNLTHRRGEGILICSPARIEALEIVRDTANVSQQLVLKPSRGHGAVFRAACDQIELKAIPKIADTATSSVPKNRLRSTRAYPSGVSAATWRDIPIYANASQPRQFEFAGALHIDY
jgi:hypothetical protein